eukprot:5035191-Ditylum_brightwellii.AAC.2
MTIPKFYEKFYNLVNMARQFRGSISHHTSLIKDWGTFARTDDNLDGEPEDKVIELAEKEYLGIVLI